MATTARTRENDRATAETGTNTVERLVTGISQVGLGLGIMLAGLTGLWALASMISAVAKSGGMFGLLRNWWAAVSGM